MPGEPGPGTATFTGAVTLVRTPEQSPNRKFVDKSKHFNEMQPMPLSASTLAADGTVITLGVGPFAQKFRVLQQDANTCQVQQMIGGKWVTITTCKPTAMINWGVTYEWEVGASGSYGVGLNGDGPNGALQGYSKFKLFGTLQINDWGPDGSGPQFRVRLYWPPASFSSGAGFGPNGEVDGTGKVIVPGPTIEYRWGRATKTTYAAGPPTTQMFEWGFSLSLGSLSTDLVKVIRLGGDENKLYKALEKIPSVPITFQVWALGINYFAHRAATSTIKNPTLRNWYEAFGKTFQHLVATVFGTVNFGYQPGTVPPPGSAARLMTTSDRTAFSSGDGPPDPATLLADEERLVASFEKMLQFMQDSGLEDIYNAAAPLIDAVYLAYAARSKTALFKSLLDQLTPEQGDSLKEKIASRAFELVLEAGLPDENGTVDPHWSILQGADETDLEYATRMVELVKEMIPKAVTEVLSDPGTYADFDIPLPWPKGTPPPPPGLPPPPGGFIPPIGPGSGFGDGSPVDDDDGADQDPAIANLDPASLDPRDVYTAAYLARLHAGYSESDSAAYASACVDAGFDVAMAVAFAKRNLDPLGYSLTSGDVSTPYFMQALAESWRHYKAPPFGYDDEGAQRCALNDVGTMMYGPPDGTAFDGLTERLATDPTFKSAFEAEYLRTGSVWAAWEFASGDPESRDLSMAALAAGATEDEVGDSLFMAAFKARLQWVGGDAVQAVTYARAVVGNGFSEAAAIELAPRLSTAEVMAPGFMPALAAAWQHFTARHTGADGVVNFVDLSTTALAVTRLVMLPGDTNGSLANFELADALTAAGAPCDIDTANLLMAFYDGITGTPPDGVLDLAELQAMVDNGVLGIDMASGALAIDLSRLSPECANPDYLSALRARLAAGYSLPEAQGFAADSVALHWSPEAMSLFATQLSAEDRADPLFMAGLNSALAIQSPVDALASTKQAMADYRGSLYVRSGFDRIYEETHDFWGAYAAAMDTGITVEQVDISEPPGPRWYEWLNAAFVGAYTAGKAQGLSDGWAAYYARKALSGK